MRKILTLSAMGAAAMTVSGCTTTANQNSGQSVLESILAGRSTVTGADLQRRITEAERHPLGSNNNPVRAHMPQGQRAYLDRLRCSNGRAPSYTRTGNVGVGVFGNIVDLYAVTCAGGEAKAVYMDMYHQGYVERRAVPGFTIVG